MLLSMVIAMVLPRAHASAPGIVPEVTASGVFMASRRACCYRRCGRRSSAGASLSCRFTLLELLVAAVASSVLMSALLVLSGVAWKLQLRSQEQQLQEAPREVVFAQLRQELSAAVPSAGVIAEPFVGEMVRNGGIFLDSLAFTAAVGTALPTTFGSELVRIDYSLRPCQQRLGTYHLLRRQWPIPLAIQRGTPEEMVMLSDVVGLQLRFFAGGNWFDSWDSTLHDNQLPEAVHLRLDFADAAGVAVVSMPLQLLLPLRMRLSASAERAGL